MVMFPKSGSSFLREKFVKSSDCAHFVFGASGSNKLKLLDNRMTHGHKQVNGGHV